MDVLAPEAIITVAEQFDTPRRIRLGRDWLADDRLRVVPLRPGELSLEHARQYVRQAFRATLEQLILKDATPDPERFPLDRALEGTMEPERLFLDKEDTAGDLAATLDDTLAWEREVLSTLDARGLTPRERQLLAYRRQHKSAAEIAALLDMPSAAAVRVAFSRLKRKLAT
jgi:DNA-binding NarL/FixJ family response regulator